MARFLERKCFNPIVLLVKSLYGHPEAGAHWERHLEKTIAEVGGEPVSEFPGSYFFPASTLLLTIYVDDFTLSGPGQTNTPPSGIASERMWTAKRKQVWSAS